MIKTIADKVFFADDKTDKLDKNDILWWAKFMISKTYIQGRCND